MFTNSIICVISGAISNQSVFLLIMDYSFLFLCVSDKVLRDIRCDFYVVNYRNFSVFLYIGLVFIHRHCYISWKQFDFFSRFAFKLPSVSPTHPQSGNNLALLCKQ